MTKINQTGQGRPLPMEGVVGVITGDFPPGGCLRKVQELRRMGMGGVEVRADLFPEPGEALRCLENLSGTSPVLFTLRSHHEGGNFRGKEEERIALNQEAIQRGASWVDVEWGTRAAVELSRMKVPLLISHHDFDGMPDLDELDRFARDVEDLKPLAIKMVPTARCLADTGTILQWLGEKPGHQCARIAFAMGEAGFPSRILSISRGSLLTYGSLGHPVAPGQISAEGLLRFYRPGTITPSSRILGAIGRPLGNAQFLHVFNPTFISRGLDAVYMPIHLDRFDELEPSLEFLGLEGISVEAPFREEAFRFSDSSDAICRSVGEADLLAFTRESQGHRSIRAHHTGAAGLLGALKRRLKDLRGLRAAVLGEGKAATLVCEALEENGVSPTICYRNMDMGLIKHGENRLIVNASGSASVEVQPSLFTPKTIAVELSPESPSGFLQAAGSAGASCISAREVLLSRLAEQFRILTGESIEPEELDRYFPRGNFPRNVGII